MTSAYSLSSCCGVERWQTDSGCWHGGYFDNNSSYSQGQRLGLFYSGAMKIQEVSLTYSLRDVH